jgi:hypothetical protein
MRNSWSPALLLLGLLIPLAGCGGSGGSQSSGRLVPVTVHIQWPAPGKAASRVVPVNAKYALVEVYDGRLRVAAEVFTRPNTAPWRSDATVPVPPNKDLTFYANVFALSPNKDTYITDTGSGQIPAALQVAPSGANTVPNPVLARGQNVRTVPDVGGTDIEFTLSNAVVAFVPVAFNPALNGAGATATQIPPIALTLNATPGSPANIVDLNTLVKGIDANGATVLIEVAAGPSPANPVGTTDLSELTWSYLPGDAASPNRITLAPDNHTATLTSTGTAQLVVTDSKVNPGQAFVQSTITFKITTPNAVTLALDDATSHLSSTTPLYAKSVKLTLTEPTLPNDFPAGPAAVVVNAVQDVTAFNLAANTVTIAPVTLSYTPSGRAFTLTAEAWSDTGGQGVLIASTTRAYASVNDPALTAAGSTLTFNAPLFPAADYKIDGFVVTPAAADIYFFSSAPPSVPGLPTSVTLQASLARKSGPGNSPLVSVSSPIAAGAVRWTSAAPAAVALSAGPVPPGTGEVATAASAVSTPTPSTITVTDSKVPAHTGTAVVTLQNTKPVFNIH